MNLPLIEKYPVWSSIIVQKILGIKIVIRQENRLWVFRQIHLIETTVQLSVLATGLYDAILRFPDPQSLNQIKAMFKKVHELFQIIQLIKPPHLPCIECIIDICDALIELLKGNGNIHC